MPDIVAGLSNRDCRFEVNILNRIEQGDALFKRSLKCFTAADETDATGTFIDHCSAYRLGHVALPGRWATGVDQSHATHVAIRDLIAAKVNWVVGRELVVNKR